MRCFVGSEKAGSVVQCASNGNICAKATFDGKQSAFFCYDSSILSSIGFTASISNEFDCQRIKPSNLEYELCVCNADDCNNPCKFVCVP